MFLVFLDVNESVHVFFVHLYLRVRIQLLNLTPPYVVDFHRHKSWPNFQWFDDRDSC